MDNGTGIVPVMNMGNNADDFGGGGFWIFALLILAMLGNGGLGWGGNGFANAIGYENLATSNEVQRGFDNQNLQAQTRDILQAVNDGTAQTVGAVNQTFHDNLMATQNLYNELARDISNVQMAQAQALANQNACCCETKQLILEKSANTDYQIAQNKYESAMQMAQMESRILQKMDANKIEDLQNQVNALQLAQAMTGVVKYPLATTYNSGVNPFCNCGCVCGI